jgi:4-hydroxy-tetrahydrodipicolinate synthase
MQLTGSLVAVVTPMHSSGEVDFDSFVKLLRWHEQQGSQGVVILGTTAESPTITGEERKQLIQKAVEEAGGRYPVIVGTGSNCTSKTIYRTKQAKELGADASLVVVPYYNKPTQEGLYEHFKAVSRAADMPMILYDNPARSVISFALETVVRLSKLPNVIGIKLTSGNTAEVKQLISACGKDFLLFDGDDATAKEFMLAGGHGVISVTANVLPKVVSELCQACAAKDTAKADELFAKLIKLGGLLFIESNPIPVKWALYKMGLIEDGIRLPLTRLSEGAREKLETELHNLGVLREEAAVN